jgi:serine/threonine protein kinase
VLSCSLVCSVKRIQRFSREALIWRQLEHPSILPFIGIDKENFEASQHMCLIAPWMNHGTLADYMKSSNYSPFQHMYPLVSPTFPLVLPFWY